MAERPDPFAPVQATPRWAATLVVVALACAALAIMTGLAPIAGPAGMGAGLVAHVKGNRWGLPATFAAGIATIVGFTIAFWLR